MKKILAVCFAFMLLTGCSKATALNETYQYSDDDGEIRYEEKITLAGTKDKEADWLDLTTSELTITFLTEEAANEYLDALNEENEAYRLCPGGTDGTDCSKYITYEYSVDGMVVKSKEVINYKEARKNKEGITADDTYSTDEYYSFDKTVDGLVEEGFTKQ